MKPQWDNLMLWLALIRLGQELGTDGPLARAVAAALDALLGRGGP